VPAVRHGKPDQNEIHVYLRMALDPIFVSFTFFVLYSNTVQNKLGLLKSITFIPLTLY
jgi:hypothetical protein